MTSDRFLTLADVAEILNISASQTYALVRGGDLQGLFDLVEKLAEAVHIYPERLLPA